MNLSGRRPSKRSRIQSLILASMLGSILLTANKADAATTSKFGQPQIVNQQVNQGIPMTAQPVAGWPDIISAAAVVVDMNTGTVLYAKNPLTPHYPASITKILTALLALKLGHLNDVLTASNLAAIQPQTNLNLQPGETASLKEWLYGLLLHSANDAAIVIAEHYGGSVAKFAEMMNREAAALGAVHTHFVNPNGLPNPNHVTTAYDMAVIARAAMQNPEFRKIVDTKTYDFQPVNGSALPVTNLNTMLFTYPGTIGIKTGYTSVAHETLAVAATRNGQTFLAILMDTPLEGQIQADAASLLDFAFSHYETETILPAGVRGASITVGKGVTLPTVLMNPVLATVPIGEHLQPAYHKPHWNTFTVGPMKKGTIVGHETIEAGGDSVSIPIGLSTAYLPPPPPQRHWPYWILGGLFAVFIGRGFVRKWTRRRSRAKVVRYRAMS